MPNKCVTHFIVQHLKHGDMTVFVTKPFLGNVIIVKECPLVKNRTNA